MAESTESLRNQATIREWSFHSDLPVVGRLVTAIRRSVHALAGKWALRSVMQQQMAFNHGVLDLIEDLRRGIQVDTQAGREQADNDLYARILNLEREMVEKDRVLLRMHRLLAEMSMTFRRDASAIFERESSLESALVRESQALVSRIADIRASAAQQGASLESVGRQLETVAEQTANIGGRLETVADQIAKTESRLPPLEDNHRQEIELRSRMEQLANDLASLQAASEEQSMLVMDMRRKQRIEQGSRVLHDNGNAPLSGMGLDELFDYFLFELRYRGSTMEIARRHEKYLPYFRPSGVVVDVGCGRGEFLALLIEHGVNARGVDLDPDMVDYCRQRGLPVELEDGLHHLASVEDNSLGGIFLGQVVEHLQPSALMRLVHLAYRKLAPDAYFVAETINPTCVLALTTHYLMDPSHVRPVHPETLRFELQSAGFGDVVVQFTEPVPDEARLGHFTAIEGMSAADQAWLPILNENVDRLNDFLYGNQDYAVIARKMVWPERLASVASRRDVVLPAH